MTSCSPAGTERIKPGFKLGEGLKNALGTIRLGTQRSTAYRPGRRDPNVVSVCAQQHCALLQRLLRAMVQGSSTLSFGTAANTKIRRLHAMPHCSRSHRDGHRELLLLLTATCKKLFPGAQVFVAGATGNVGSRAVRELLAQGFKVRFCLATALNLRSLLMQPSMARAHCGSGQCPGSACTSNARTCSLTH